ncbi:MAG: hypothetical protein Q9201_004125 [Fulgogasparrea decipioides]
MADPLDDIIGICIHHLERLTNNLRPRSQDKVRDILPYIAYLFSGLRTTSSDRGRDFANKVEIVLKKAIQYYPLQRLDGLEDFIMRQQTASCEREVMQLKKELHEPADEEKEGKTRKIDGSDIKRDKTPNGQAEDVKFIPSSPFSMNILSINTNKRMLVAKDGAEPVVLTFNDLTQAYGLEELECEHKDLEIGEKRKRLLHSLDPERLAYVAWSPGFLFVHTRTKDYKKSKGKLMCGGYCNLGVVDVDGLECLVEHLKERNVIVEMLSE